MILYKASVLLWVGVSAIPLVCQDMHIANDLPALSRQVSVNECSPTHYVSDFGKWTYPYPNSDHSSWMRAKIVVDQPWSDRSWEIRINVDNHTIQKLTPRDLADDGKTLWTKLIVGDQFTIEFGSNNDVDGMKVCLDSINIPATAVSIKSVIDNKDDRVDLVTVYGINSRYYSYGRAVVLIRFQDQSNGGTETNCTGVVLSATLVATNYHCINEHTNLGTAFVVVGHETGQSEQEAAVICLMAKSSVLDYSIIRINRELTDIAKVSVGGLKKNAPLILIQHPEGKPKLIAVVSKTKCFVQQNPARDRQTDFYHLCDSSGGSSGSPVMDEKTGIVYGLHHLGVTDPKRQDYHNLAVSFREIRDDVRDRFPSVYKEIGALSQASN